MAAPIFDAARAGDVEALRQALEAEPQLLAARDADQRTPLAVAAAAGQAEAVKELLQRGE
jgi:ankyrin repeat protein